VAVQEVRWDEMVFSQQTITHISMEIGMLIT